MHPDKRGERRLGWKLSLTLYLVGLALAVLFSIAADEVLTEHHLLAKVFGEMGGHIIMHHFVPICLFMFAVNWTVVWARILRGSRTAIHRMTLSRFLKGYALVALLTSVIVACFTNVMVGILVISEFVAVLFCLAVSIGMWRLVSGLPSLQREDDDFRPGPFGQTIWEAIAEASRRPEDDAEN
jgi:hypothetical protein